MTNDEGQEEDGSRGPPEQWLDSSCSIMVGPPDFDAGSDMKYGKEGKGNSKEPYWTNGQTEISGRKKTRKFAVDMLR